MKKFIGYRASAILYNWLKSNMIQIPILLPCNICETVPAVYMKLGLKILWCDICPDTLQMNHDIVRQTAAQLDGRMLLHYNHTYGYINDDEYKFLERLKAYYPDLIIVDDCCLCSPILHKWQSFIDLTLYSTGYAKYVDMGEGGYCLTQDKYTYVERSILYNEKEEELFDKHIKECHRLHKPVDKRIMVSNWLRTDYEEKTNYFQHVEERHSNVSEHKRKINIIYSNLNGSLLEEYNNWRWNILVENQKECVDALFKAGLYCSNHYKSLCNGYFSNYKTPVCDYLYSHVLNLFNDFRYTEEQAERTLEILNQVSIPIKDRLVAVIWKK